MRWWGNVPLEMKAIAIFFALIRWYLYKIAQNDCVTDLTVKGARGSLSFTIR